MLTPQGSYFGRTIDSLRAWPAFPPPQMVAQAQDTATSLGVGKMLCRKL